jgi:hypothetical protein
MITRHKRYSIIAMIAGLAGVVFAAPVAAGERRDCAASVVVPTTMTGGAQAAEEQPVRIKANSN